MGLFSRLRSAQNVTENVTYTIELIEKTLAEQPNIQNEVIAMLIFFAAVTIVRLLSKKRLDMLSGEHVLNISWLNDANLHKEVFLAYLNAALLEPVLAIAGMQEVVGAELRISILTLISICWWIWLVTDAFDYEDVMQNYKYHVDLAQEVAESKDPKKYSWLRLENNDNHSERRSLVGSLRKDVALWFMLACIGAAWAPGIVSHRDVVHAYVIVLLWIILHHSCHKATSWSAGYFFTFLFPSTALMPLEYCLPITNVSDFVEDLEFLEKYREFVQERTGVELIIVS